MSKQYEEDDGRTIADMSGLAPRTPFGFRRKERRELSAPAEESREDRPWEQQGTSREDRRSYIWGALSAALLIALAFIVGLGLIILLISCIFS